jgi:hypothetical protein
MTETEFSLPALADINPAAVARFTGARDALLSSEKLEMETEANRARAIADISNPRCADPVAALAAKRKAEAELADLDVLLPVLRLRWQDATREMATAEGGRHSERYDAGRVMRMQAAAGHEAALAAIEAAKALAARGTALIEAAHNAGRLRAMDGSHLERPCVSVAGEAAMWAEAGQ